jgi:hypothetical protein
MKNSVQKLNFYAFLLSLMLFAEVVRAQTIPVGTPVLDEYLRRAQLLVLLDSTSSFMIRPLYPSFAFGVEDGFDLDGTEVDLDESKLHGRFGFKTKGKFLMLPVSYRIQYNSDYAHGGNDGSFIPNRGIQTSLTGGFFATKGIFSLQFQPEVLAAQNKDYIGFPIEQQSTILFYHEYVGRIDMPERFGDSSFNQFLLGQSSFRINYQALSVGVSTENLWWGPGRRNSLLMSNNAPGFVHFTANTRKPVTTKIGSFEGQLISGFLKSSNHLPPHSDYSIQQNPVYIPKREDGNRYMSGLVLTYQPKWISGLFLGYGSVSNLYRNELVDFADYLPIFNGRKGSPEIFDPIRDKRQQMSSGFFRWLSTTGKFEFYGEYGTNGNSRTFNDFIIQPESGRGYTVGFSYLMDLKKEGHYLEVNSEMTQTGQTLRTDIRNLTTWYIHDHVRHGYTHNGQVLGMGAGPASNSLFVEFAWVHKKMNRIGIQGERIAYNNDFYYYRFEEVKDIRNRYVDLVPSLIADWKFGGLLVSAKFQYVNSLNYKWYLENSPDKYFIPGYDRTNLVGQLGLTYLLR